MQTATNATFGGFTLAELSDRGFQVKEATAYDYGGRGITVRLISPNSTIIIDGQSQEATIAMMQRLGFVQEGAS